MSEKDEVLLDRKAQLFSDAIEHDVAMAVNCYLKELDGELPKAVLCMDQSMHDLVVEVEVTLAKMAGRKPAPPPAARDLYFVLPISKHQLNVLCLSVFDQPINELIDEGLRECSETLEPVMQISFTRNRVLVKVMHNAHRIAERN